ncbi:MAG: NAD(+)/NADH kinase [bacterium]|nr:NAD(+)/NADH kinase [bacterium]
MTPGTGERTPVAVGLLGNAAKPDIGAAVAAAAAACRKHGLRLLAAEELAAAAAISGVNVLPEADLVAACDVVVALGGDGTMLRAVRAVGDSAVPLLGVNLGSLGYLTDIPLPELGRAFGQLAAGEFHLEDRTQVRCAVGRGGSQVSELTALNDLVINMGPLPRAIEMELRLDGDSLGHFLGDGVVVATPTGSTAYNLSAGGPICQTSVPCLLIAPICPHALGMRPLVVPEPTRIEIILLGTGEGAVLTADGQEVVRVGDGDHLDFGLARARVRLVKFPQSSFYRVMRHKLNWGGPRRREQKGR